MSKLWCVCKYNYITKNRRKNQDSTNNVNVRNIINTQCHIIIHNTACAVELSLLNDTLIFDGP